MTIGSLTLHVVSTKALLRALSPKVGDYISETRHQVAQCVIGHLLASPGQCSEWKELIEAVYGGDPNGGPAGAKNNVYFAAKSLRQKGWPIRVMAGRGLLLDLRLLGRIRELKRFGGDLQSLTLA